MVFGYSMCWPEPEFFVGRRFSLSNFMPESKRFEQHAAELLHSVDASVF